MTGANRFGILPRQVPEAPAVRLVLSAPLHPSERLRSYPRNVPKPCGQRAASPALRLLCRERESFPLAASRAPLTSANEAWGVSVSCVHGEGGDAVAGYLHRCNCEGILHSSVPVSLIQHYRVLGKGVGANALPSPSFDHCVILFFLHELCIVRWVLPRFSN